MTIKIRNIDSDNSFSLSLYPNTEEHPECSVLKIGDDEADILTHTAEFNFSVETFDELIANAEQFVTQLNEAKKSYEARNLEYIDIINLDLD